MNPRLECTGLTGGRGISTVFRELDLSLESGRILALVGANGAGKTTLLLTLAGVLPLADGEVRVDGEPVRSGRPRAASRAGVVLVPDDRCLFTGLTVRENLQVAARRGGPTPSDLLDVFPALRPRIGLAAESLSGGEQQMLAMARALIQQPKVLLVDELSMGLAPQIVETLLRTVRESADTNGCAVVLVEQHVDLALEFADDAIVLNRGRITLQGAASELAADRDRMEQAYFGGTLER
ncbi:ABC transporter ATP-binding protein [Cryptosporangium aurantiacum]|uniref:Amino acid/amide ABC transporter ATP-binding protein 2, HAAT family n=1 Tax=Cryptosporangium aurantiacum TaxID=134849 RepID=A0A1M7RGF8_9ACTN|nr:ABC transporter ATP-binding protein [Cryptosporangium aurantiacum]SHN45251.1 amino acid/amide ABC transporter ATP-binding protein 2, HAAT family [Cryptosporangium aurantiacum]